MRHSLQTKLLVSFMAVIIFLLGVVFFGISVVIREHTLTVRQGDLQVKGGELAAALKQIYERQGNFEHLDALLTDADNYLGARIWIVDRSQAVVTMSGNGMGRGHGMHMQNGHMGMQRSMSMNNRMGVSGMNEVLDAALTQGSVSAKTYDNAYYDERMLVTAVPVVLDDGQIPGAVLLMAPMSDINTYMTHLYRYLLIAGILAIIGAVILVSWLTRRIVRPLKEMEQSAQAMARGDYGNLVHVQGEDEVGQLGQSLNSLARDMGKYIGEIEKMEKLRRDFTANVSHELRTPLTIIRGYNEALLSGALEEGKGEEYCCLIREETLRLERLIRDLLDLSRLQSAKDMSDTEPIPLADLAEGVIMKFRHMAEQKNVHLAMEIDSHKPCILGNGDRIMQLFMIFLDNAIKYTPSGGQATLRVATEDKCALVAFSDTGRGIPEADIPYIWERFYKVDKSHRRDDTGTGLGLAIARQIIDLHGASVTVDSAPGQGTTFTIRFPLYEK